MTDQLERMTLAELIDQIAAKLDNAWPVHRDECLVADHLGKAAFWTRTGAERASIMLIVQHASRDNLHRAIDRYWTANTAETIDTLDQLIPLNHEAVMQLRLAYSGIGRFPSLASLYDRRHV